MLRSLFSFLRKKKYPILNFKMFLFCTSFIRLLVRVPEVCVCVCVCVTVSWNSSKRPKMLKIVCVYWTVMNSTWDTSKSSRNWWLHLVGFWDNHIMRFSRWWFVQRHALFRNVGTDVPD
jgi:hypothetical protein